MTHALETPATGSQPISPDPLLHGPILVATDGTTSANAALVAARQLSDATNAAVHVLGVLEPLPMTAADYGLLLPPLETDDARREALARRVREQVAEIVGTRASWTIELRDGDPAAVITRTAREEQARIVILGIGHHQLLDRIFGSETALHTLRLSRVPVFAIAPDFQHLPQRIIIAVDFSESSMVAATTALALLGDVQLIYLVHVAPRYELQPEAFAAWMATYSEGVVPAFERLREGLEFPTSATVETITLHGKPSRALLEFARSANVDTIVSGSRGAGLIDRILVGSTATGLLRGAACSVLAIPTPFGGAASAGAEPPKEGAIPEAEWAEVLAAFTKRNAGRIASLEVDDPEFGAQAQQHDYPFIGAAYDHHDRRVELMLGDMERSTRHLTRGIGDVRSIDLLRDEHGGDLVLRIAHGSGQTILTLTR